MNHYKGFNTKTIQFLEFHKARKYLHKLKIKNSVEYSKLWKTKKFKKIPKTNLQVLPSDLSNHYRSHKDWKGQGDFLGSGLMKNGDQEYRSYEEAKKFAQSLGIKTYIEWTKFAKTRKKPKDIPYAIHAVYKEFKSYGEFLGTGRRSWKDGYMSFSKSRTIAQKEKLTSRGAFEKWHIKDKPKDIPRTPQYIYKKEWKGWENYLGKSYSVLGQRQYMPYEQSQRIVRKHKIKSQAAFSRFARDEKLPVSFSHTPESAYKKQWKGWSEYLGTEKPYFINENKLWSYEKTSKYLKKYGVKSSLEFRKLMAENKFPKQLPRSPYYFYERKGTWKGWGHILGNNRIYKSKGFKWLSYDKARKFVRTLKLKTSNEWIEFSKSGKRPFNIPSTIPQTYKKDWTDWKDFLGIVGEKFAPFEEARKFALTLNLKSSTEWYNYIRNNKTPLKLPVRADMVYGRKRSSWRR